MYRGQLLISINNISYFEKEKKSMKYCYIFLVIHIHIL